MRYLAMSAACAVVALLVVGTSVGAQAEQITIQIPAGGEEQHSVGC
jgi:hypothetical protein